MFCGWVNNARSRTVERFSYKDWTTNGVSSWARVDILNDFEERLLPGVIQTSMTEISIYGGFGKNCALKDCLKYDLLNQKVTRDNGKEADRGIECYNRRP